MRNIFFIYGNKKQWRWFAVHILFIYLFICLIPVVARPQGCPVNIDFESGGFSGWTCWVGSVASVNNQNVISLTQSGGPVGGQHTMMSFNPGDGLDEFGHFAVNCPNGSGHSIKLGNTSGGAQAEGVSYEFTIPANKDVYSIIYHYAVVFQDPDHLESEQPRMEIEITNVSDNEIIHCSSFTFHPYGSVLPGFQLSDNPGGSTPVWFKDWSAVSINLDGRAGKTIRMFFKTADCTFRRHFGYAYIDVNSECSGEFVGAAYCPDDTAVNVVAPYGYQGYKWFNSSFTQVIGTSQTLTLSRPPVAGATIAVELTPYDGYGCLDTLYAKLLDTLTTHAHAGPPMLSCNLEQVQLGELPRAGLVYTWTPATDLSNAAISNPFTRPTTTTLYKLKVNNSGGGCVSYDSVLVTASLVDTSIQLVGKAAYCITSNDSAILNVRPTGTIQWFRDGIPIKNANQASYRVPQSGAYYALVSSPDGCTLASSPHTIYIEVPKPAITYPIQFAVVNLPLTLKARQFGITAAWKPGANLDNPIGYTPVFKSFEDQLYMVTITTAAGCVTVDTQFVKTINGVMMRVPNAFTPNSDRKNDLLRPVLMGIKELHYFRVYNRWGLLMFEAKNEQTGWDGKFNGKEQTTQTVVWEVEGTGLDGKVYKQRGTSVLIR